MPAERIQKTKTPESVPDIGDPDRKRVLNVLAQRRYRQRRREKVAALEAQAKGIPSPPTTQHEDAQVDLELEAPFGSFTSIDLEGFGEVEEVVRMPPQQDVQMFDFGPDPFDMSLMPDFNSFSALPSPIPLTPSPAHSRQSPSSPSLQFPLTSDGAVLSIPILSALRAFASVALALDVATHIWDPFYLHVLPQSIPALVSLPTNLHPVGAQHNIPHHPVLDLLPWPSVREKLICMLAMPSSFRPPGAQEDDDHGGSSIVKQSGAIVQLVQDLDDVRDGGGVRVHGNTSTWSEGNELLEEAWEVGDLFYRKWWWCLDQQIVEVSNRRRKERGLGRLRMVGTG